MKAERAHNHSPRGMTVMTGEFILYKASYLANHVLSYVVHLQLTIFL